MTGPRPDTIPPVPHSHVPGTAGGAASDADGRLAVVHQRLLTAVADLTIGDGWQRLLRTAAALPSYSPHNVLLITAQRPDARAVAGFHTWKSLGRRVRKGEKGIAILAPVLRRGPRQTADGLPATAQGPDAQRPAGQGPVGHGTTGQGGAERPAELAVPRRLVGFRVVHVFDIDQTDGPELPEPPRPVLLDGQAPPGLVDGLIDQVHAQEFGVIRHDFDVPHPGQSSPNGVTDYFARTVLIRPDLTPAQTAKTLAHELGHVLLHAPGQRPAALTREQAEVEAESVAYVVTAAHGLDSGNYSIPYVAGWSAGNTELVARTAERVLSTARDILQRTPPPPTLQLDDDTRASLLRQRTAAPAPERPDPLPRTRPATDRPGVVRTQPPHPAQPDTTIAHHPGDRAAEEGRLW